MLLPGLALATAAALLAYGATVVTHGAARLSFGSGWAPPMVATALVVGLLMHRIGRAPTYAAGLDFCARPMLRVLVALLGLRVALADLSHLGIETAAAVGSAMVVSQIVTFSAARILGLPLCTAALVGAANTVCGAAATLAAAAVLPPDRDRTASIALTIVLSNIVSTAAMLLYPVLGLMAGLSPLQTGVMIGASIQDVAQVLGAGLGLPADAADASITVKMFRVLMLFPTVVALAWIFGRRSGDTTQQVRVPRFAIGFVVLCLANSALLTLPATAAPYAAMRPHIIDATTAGLVVASAALGLNTSLGALRMLGAQPVVLFATATLAMLAGALAVASLVP